MLTNLLVVAGQVATLFLMMGVGFALRRLKRLTPEALSQMTFLLLYIVAPCLIIDSLSVGRDTDALRGIGLSALGCVVFFIAAIGTSSVLFRRQPPDTRDVLRFGAVYPNAGFMGFPLVRAVLGPDAMLYATVFLVVFNLLHWTHGVILMGGREHASPKSALLNPGTLGFLAGFLLFMLRIRLPGPVGNAVRFMSEINTPLAMVIIGAQMADADIVRLFKTRALYGMGIARLLWIPALTAAALFPFHLPPLVYCTMVILSAAPSAGITAMFAQRFGRDTTTGAGAVTLTTLVSILTLPVFAAAAQAIVS